MAKYIGPKCKLSRRAGVDLGLKSGVRDHATKCKSEVLPGARAGQRATRPSDFGVMLGTKQRVRRIYGVLERQFRNYYKKAASRKGATGENLMQLLESRLDNIVYRIGFASTRAEARQLVNHKGVLVNGETVNIPSYQVKPEDKISVREKCKKQGRIQAAMELAQQRGIDDWITVDSKEFSGVYKFIPALTDLPPDLNVNLIVEYYSK